jgi:von Willebrand factor A domain-containing protein 8
MSLEDGRFLVHPIRFDSLTIPENTHLVRVSDRFIVIALGLPVPKYDGYPLDPPFRSRFQARYIALSEVQTQLDTLCKKYSKIPSKTLEQLISVSMVLQNIESDLGGSVPNFPAYLERQCSILELLPSALLGDTLSFCYPYLSMVEVNEQLKNTIKSALSTFQIKIQHDNLFAIKLLCSDANTKGFELTLRGHNYPFELITNSVTLYGIESNIVSTEYLNSLEAQLLLGLSVGDVCIIGPKGAGKSMLVRKVCRSLSQPTIFIPVYKDLTSRDLLQKRTTNINGDTVWVNSGLVEAAILGYFAILDGVDLLDSGAFSSIQRLIFEREIALPDGTRLMNYKSYKKLVDRSGYSEGDFAREKIVCVHPAFKILALAKSDNFSSPNKDWLKGEPLSMFAFLYVRPMEFDEEIHVLKSLFPNMSPKIIFQICTLAQEIRTETDEVLKDLAVNFSTRQLKRIAGRMNSFPDECLYSIIIQTCIYIFLPKLSKEALREYLKKHDISPVKKQCSSINIVESLSAKGPMLDVGGIIHPISRDSNPAMVPKVTFYENQRQLQIIQVFLVYFRIF